MQLRFYLLLALWLLSSAALAQSLDLMRLIEQYQSAAQRGKIERALSAATEALQQAEQDFGSEHKETAFILADLGRFSVLNHQFK